MPKCVFGSFSEPLPVIKQLGEQTTRAHVSGSTTDRSTAPLCGLRTPLEVWTSKADVLCLQRFKETLRRVYLPEVETSLRFKSEADIVNSSAVYLLNPVHFALQLARPDFIYLSEVTKSRDEISSTSSRADRVYFTEDPDPAHMAKPGNSPKCFAVLEFKKYGGLPVDAFEKGIVTNNGAYQKAISDQTSKFRDDAETLFKQVTQYAARYNTPFVALCDYKTLVLLVMVNGEDLHGGDVSTQPPPPQSPALEQQFHCIQMASDM